MPLALSTNPTATATATGPRRRLPAAAAACMHALARALRLAAVRHGATHRRLPRHATVWIDRPQGCRIRCESGTLWLTFDNELEDVILEAGQMLACTQSSRLSIHALAAAALSVA